MFRPRLSRYLTFATTAVDFLKPQSEKVTEANKNHVITTSQKPRFKHAKSLRVKASNHLFKPTAASLKRTLSLTGMHRRRELTSVTRTS